MKRPSWEELRFAYDEGFTDAEKTHACEVLVGPVTKESLWQVAEKRIREAYGAKVPGMADEARRDFFAAHAIQGLLAGHSGLWPGAEADWSAIAEMAYQLADRMLTERAKEEA